MENKPLPLFIALAKAQGTFSSAIKDSENPFFKSTYADLTAVWDSCKEAIKENGLIVMQPTIYLESAGAWVVNTRIYDQSGNFVEGNTPILASKQNDPQAFGSATTYARRYGLAALLGIVTEDDDAEGAMSRDNNKKPAVPAKPANPASVRTENNLSLVQAQYRELLNNSVIEDHQRKEGLLKVNTYTEEQLTKKIAALNKYIEEKTIKAA
jgi:hypothetical protein